MIKRCFGSLAFSGGRALFLARCIGVSMLAGASVQAAESFSVNFAEEPKTLGDIKPAFLSFEQEQLPAIPVREVIRRYRQLFDSTSVPDVRIDALHRLTSLESKYGEGKDRTPEEERRMYQMALESYEKMSSGTYEMIVGAGVYYKRIDELLYQTAKAYDITGRHDQALRSLEQLVGLYPASHLAVEAWFRIGETHFSLGNYDQAVRAYSQVMEKGAATHFEDKARFMLGWAYYKQGKGEQSTDTFVAVLDNLQSKAKAASVRIDELGGNDKETLEDTLRVLCLSFSYDAGANSLERLLGRNGDREYSWLLYDRLAALYMKQQRYEDGAQTARSFMERYPDSAKSPRMAVFVITAYAQGRFFSKVQEEKERFVAYYMQQNAARSSWDASDKMYLTNQLETYLTELSRYYFLQAQEAAKAAGDSLAARENYARAGDYYVQLETVAPNSPEIGRRRFLAGEAFFNAARFDDAVHAYERSAYQSAEHADAANAGYAAIMAFDRLLAQPGAQSSVLLAQRKNSILNFDQKFSDDERGALLLGHLAGELVQQQNHEDAMMVADRLVKHSKASKELKRTGWLSLGQAAFAMNQYSRAEEAYTQASLLMGRDHELLGSTRERIAAAIYKQAEVAAGTSNNRAAVEHFLRIEKITPDSAVVPNAKYDAAVRLMEMQAWPEAIVQLESFSKQFGGHELQKDVPQKLIYAYLQHGDKEKAAGMLVALAKNTQDSDQASKALYQAAELYEQVGQIDTAMKLFEQYTQQHPQPFDLYVEAHNRLAEHYLARVQGGESGAGAAHEQWLKKLIAIDQKAGSNTTERAHFLAGKATLTLANKALPEFVEIKLTLPLPKSLKQKRAALETVVKAYNQVLGYGFAELSTEATFRLADIYRQLSADLIGSERPKGLDELELEQYSVLLEEQAYPYEEKAIELYEINASRTKDGVYDKWVQESFLQLGKMVPANYKRQQKVIRHVSDFK